MADNIEELSVIVWKVLSSVPIEVLDEESNSLVENQLWELVDNRLEGDFTGTRNIGSGNLASAFNMIHMKLIARNVNQESVMYAFTQTLELLEAQRLIRQKPDKLRQTFKVV